MEFETVFTWLLVFLAVLGAVRLIFESANSQDSQIVLSNQPDNNGGSCVNSGEFHLLLHADVMPEEAFESKIKETFKFAPGPYPHYWFKRDFYQNLNTTKSVLIFSHEDGGFILNSSYSFALSGFCFLTILEDGRMLIFRFLPENYELATFIIRTDQFARKSGFDKVEAIDLTRNEGRVRPISLAEIRPGTTVTTGARVNSSALGNTVFLVVDALALSNCRRRTDRFWLVRINLATGDTTTNTLEWLDSERIDMSRQYPCIAAPEGESVLVTGENCPIFRVSQDGNLIETLSEQT